MKYAISTAAAMKIPGRFVDWLKVECGNVLRCDI